MALNSATHNVHAEITSYFAYKVQYEASSNSVNINMVIEISFDICAKISLYMNAYFLCLCYKNLFSMNINYNPWP